MYQRLLADDFPLDDEARMRFGLFLGLQWLRGRAARQTGEEIHDLFHKLVVTLGLDLDPGTDPGVDCAGIRDEPPLGAGPAFEIPRLGHWPEEVKQALRDTDSYSFPAPREQLLLHMVQGVPAVAEVFLVMNGVG